MFDIRKILFASSVAGALSASAALAAPPANVVGTWQALLGTEVETLVITNQGGPGAPGASQCLIVIGTIGIAPVRGYYCPGNGRIHLLHENLSTRRTVRDFSGIVAEDPATNAAQIAGTFHILAVAFGDYGEYPFSASK